jgi:ubiquinone/menaquinone biosynthesis C-methylase UbiE
MSPAQPQLGAAPFDAVALEYDDAFTCSVVGRAQRLAVWKELANAFRAGDRVFEIGCGTGEDACFLAQHGIRVTACDSSSQMIAVTNQKIAKDGLQDLVSAMQLQAENISRLRGGESFDGAFSNFGALNCIPDLRRLARDLAGMLRPGANVVLCWMGPTCLWEMLWYLAHGTRERAFRRLKRGGVTASLGPQASVHVHYPTVRFLVAAFAPEFRLKSVTGIGVAVPPSYAELWVRRHPRWLRFFQRADGVLSKLPGMRLLGDHVLVHLQREPVQ